MVAATAYYVVRQKRGLPKDNEETAHDDVGEGVSWVHHRNHDHVQTNGMHVSGV